MIMHNNNEDFINSRLTEDAGFSLTNAERNLRIKQLSFQSSQAEHWAFEALREARRSRHAAQATLGVVLSFAAMLIVIISFKLQKKMPSLWCVELAAFPQHSSCL